MWRSVRGARFFLVPRDAEPAAGSFEVWAADVGVRRVSEAWCEPYEVPAAEAERWARGRLDSALGQVKDTVGGMVGYLGNVTDRLRSDREEALGQSAAKAHRDVRAAAEKLQDAFGDVGKALRRAMGASSDDER